jgi:cell division protein FtsB
MNAQLSRETGIVLVVMLVGLAIAALLAFGVLEQVERLQRIQAAEAQLAPLVVREKERNERLQQELERASSPQYVEGWARIYAGMGRDGEVVLWMPPAGQPHADPAPGAEGAQTAVPFWTTLWQQLTGGGGD